MIELSGITIGYGRRILLDNVSSKFCRGRLTALIGRNGSGKSTLLRTIAGLNRDYLGKIIINGDPDLVRSADRAKIIAFVNTSRQRIANLRCRDVVALGRAPYTNWYGRMQPQDEAAVSAALEKVGMSEYADRTLDHMSDGECQRVMIARALAQDTPVILLDEPTSFLDLPNRHELCSLLADLARNDGKCILFSTHELDIAMRLSDKISLIDTPNLITLPTKEMMSSGAIDRLFHIHL